MDLSGGIIASSSAKNKKIAEQEASRLALEKLSLTLTRDATRD